MTDLAVTTDLTETAARELTDAIKQTVGIVWRQIERAYLGRAWVALGYGSWDDYCETEFDGARLRLPREERTMVVGSLRDAGMSTRAIAAATGMAQSSVVRELSGEPNGSPDPDADIVDGGVVDVGEITHKPVTGADGKKYPATKSPTPRVDAIRDLAKLGLTAEQIAEDIGITAGRVSNIARTNKIRLPGNTVDREERWKEAAELAGQGYSSRQVAEQLGISDTHLREEARKRGIEFPADAHVLRTRHLDSARIVAASVAAVDGIGIMFDAISYADLDPEDVKGWLPILDDSIRSLTTLRNELRKVSQP